MAERVTYLTERQARRARALTWDNPHSARIQREYGDPKLRCAWHGGMKRWVLAYIERVGVISKQGRRETVEFEHLPVQFKIWQDDEGRALDINDPRLVPHLKASDSRRGAVERTVASVEAEEADEDMKLQELEDEFAYIFKNTSKVWSDFASANGLVPHRAGGSEGGKISSASLWRIPAPKRIAALTIGESAAA